MEGGGRHLSPVVKTTAATSLAVVPVATASTVVNTVVTVIIALIIAFAVVVRWLFQGDRVPVIRMLCIPGITRVVVKIPASIVTRIAGA